MKIKLTSIMVDDQEKALKFYSDILSLLKNRHSDAKSSDGLLSVWNQETDRLN